MEEEISSLSAILLDEEYYNFIQSHKTQIDEISLLSIEGLIALKVKAYLDLSERKSKGEQIDSKDIKKMFSSDIPLFLSSSQILFKRYVFPLLVAPSLIFQRWLAARRYSACFGEKFMVISFAVKV